MTASMRRRIAALTLIAAGLVMVPATAAQAVFNPPTYRQTFYGPNAMSACIAAAKAGLNAGEFDQYQCVAGIPGSNIVTLLGYSAP
ncbi:hypothetical protein [Kitasatospora sp. SUK 42]|uniref:hypothetical protein n=1 Tax=Kitasatospora sp. SUK 42 TaxID=1588882 RepID=UPI001C31A90B|nr:hypothetical protein [Kitasatospora sp. SUK 42]MBV2155608.1 hypothetical protein [Kitasatospora sp. SUK 42]